MYFVTVHSVSGRIVPEYTARALSESAGSLEIFRGCGLRYNRYDFPDL